MIAETPQMQEPIARWAKSAASRNVPITFDLMMYEDGTMAESDLAIFKDVRQSVYGN
jgi:hypothetical protein